MEGYRHFQYYGYGADPYHDTDLDSNSHIYAGTQRHDYTYRAGHGRAIRYLDAHGAAQSNGAANRDQCSYKHIDTNEVPHTHVGANSYKTVNYLPLIFDNSPAISPATCALFFKSATLVVRLREWLFSLTFASR